MTDAEGQLLVLRADGASRGNPGPAAAGVVIQTEDGQVLARERHYLGEMTNNQAEYRALILGLQAVARYAPAVVLVRMDSELVVNQMLGRYRVRDEGLRPLYAEARALVVELPEVRFAHVRRAQNAQADRLANKALDERARGMRSRGGE